MVKAVLFPAAAFGDFPRQGTRIPSEDPGYSSLGNVGTQQTAWLAPLFSGEVPVRYFDLLSMLSGSVL